MISVGAKKLLICTLLIGFASSSSLDNNIIKPLLESEDASLTVPQIIAKYGYPVEVHHITTADGYILEAHRIPYGKKSGPGENKPVAWLQHGLLGDSANYIMNTEEKALAYQLANAGYDVWLGNARGNTYSRSHVYLSNTSAEFWDFSWHQMGVYDLPAVFDYVLELTGQPDLYYTGHSMGTTMFFICMSERPEYNSKIRLMNALAPVTYVGHMTSPIALIAPIANTIEDVLQFLGAYEFLPNSDLLKFFGSVVCKETSPWQGVCGNIFFLIGGFMSSQMNATNLPAIIGHVPAGSSTRSVVHYGQGVNTNLFRKFNHGKVKNMQLYGQETPPEYDISKITCPVALYWGQMDWLTVPTDVYRLAEELPNMVRKYRVPHNEYNHLDFLFAKDNDILLHGPLMDFMKYF